MVAVQVVIDRIPDISCPEGSSKVVSHSKAMYHFPHAVEVVILWERTSELDELILEDQLRTSCREEHVSGGLADDGERKCWVVAPNEVEIVVRDRGGCICIDGRLFDKSLWEDEPRAVGGADICGGDFDVETICRLIFDCEIESINVCSIDIACISSDT